MAQKQLEFVDRAQKKVDKMVQKKTGMQQDFLSEEDRQEAYIAHQLKKAKTEEFLPSQNPTDPGLGFIFPDIPESQDVTGMELGLYNAQNQPPAMNKEDFAIITTTLDGIVNRINVLSDEIGTHTTVLMKKLEELTSKKPRNTLQITPLTRATHVEKQNIGHRIAHRKQIIRRPVRNRSRQILSRPARKPKRILPTSAEK